MFLRGLTPARIPFVLAAREAYEQPAAFSVELGGPWGFTRSFGARMDYKLPEAQRAGNRHQTRHNTDAALGLAQPHRCSEGDDHRRQLPDGWKVALKAASAPSIWNRSLITTGKCCLIAKGRDQGPTGDRVSRGSGR